MQRSKVVNILIVEDGPAIQELLAFNVKQCGCYVIQTYGVSEAWAYINRILPQVDIILLDWLLPDGYGIDLLRNLCADQRTYHIPVNDGKAFAGESGLSQSTHHISTNEATLELDSYLGPSDAIWL